MGSDTVSQSQVDGVTHTSTVNRNPSPGDRPPSNQEGCRTLPGPPGRGGYFEFLAMIEKETGSRLGSIERTLTALLFFGSSKVVPKGRIVYRRVPRRWNLYPMSRAGPRTVVQRL